MKALGNPVGSAKAPHSDNFLVPGLNRFAQRLQSFERGIQELLSVAQKDRDKFYGPALVDVFDQEQAAELLFEVPESIKCRKL